MIIRKQENEKMSRIVEHNGTIYFAGIVSDNRELDIKVQTKRALEIAEEKFKDARTDKHHLLKVEVFLKDIYKDFAGFNEVWKEWVSADAKPARACVESNMISNDALLVLIFTAAKI